MNVTRDIVRRHSKRKEAISAIAEELSMQQTQIHQWAAQTLEPDERAFEKIAKSDKAEKMAETKINSVNEHLDVKVGEVRVSVESSTGTQVRMS